MTTPPSQLRTLLAARLTALRNRLTAVAPTERATTIGLLIAAAAVVVGLGHLSAPALMAPPREVAVGGVAASGETLPAGTTALEAAFWLGTLAASIVTFRVMEILFRRSDLRAVEPYPVGLSALFVDRLLATLLEAAIAAAGVSLFFLPLVWHDGAFAALLACALTGVGLLTAGVVGFAIQIYAGDLDVRSRRGDDEARRSTGVYGGSGQTFLFAPGIAFAVAAMLMLLARLSFGEVLGDAALTRPFWVGVGALGAVALVALTSAYRRFVARFPAMTARFREADMRTYEVEIEYQRSAYGQPRRGEGLLSTEARGLFRATALQYARRYALLRYSYAIGWSLAALALTQWSRGAFPDWAVAMLPAVAAATVANPWARLQSDSIQPGYGDVLPLSDEVRLEASSAVAARELLLLALPYAGLVLLVDGPGGNWGWASLSAATSVFAPLALGGATALARRFLRRDAATVVAAPVGTAVALLVVAYLSVPAALIASILLAGATVPAVR